MKRVSRCRRTTPEEIRQQVNSLLEQRQAEWARQLRRRSLNWMVLLALHVQCRELEYLLYEMEEGIP